MNNQKEIAVKVMKLANDFTNWGFQMKKEDDAYLVWAELYNQKGNKMVIYYVVGEEESQLMVLSPNSRYDDCYVNERINAIPLEHPIYATGMGKYSLSINSPMSTEVLDSQMGAIVLKRMADMAEAMTDIINHCN